VFDPNVSNFRRRALQAFAIALLAQLLLCLSASPILSARQWSARLAEQQQGKTAHAGDVTIQAAVDSENIRPDELSEAGKKRVAKSVHAQASRLCSMHTSSGGAAVLPGTIELPFRPTLLLAAYRLCGAQTACPAALPTALLTTGPPLG